MNKGSSKVSNVKFEDVGVGNGKGSMGKRREAIRKGLPLPPILSFSSSLAYATSKAKDKAPDLANAPITAFVLE